MKKLAGMVRFVLGRNWVIPVVGLVGSACCTAAVMVLSTLSRSAGVGLRSSLGRGLDGALLVQMLLFVGLPLWLVVFTVRRLIRKQGGIGRAWLWSLLAGVGMMFCLSASSMFTMFGDFDDFALEHQLPEELSPEHKPGMAVPLDFSFLTINDEELSPVAKKWQAIMPEDTGVVIAGDEVLSESAPNVEKLAANAPELLLEYKLRAICHRALTPGVKSAPHLELLRHAGEHSCGEKVTTWRHSEDDVIWQKPLKNGWEIYTRRYRFHGEDGPAPYDLKKLQMLDEALAPLAANPTPEGLDALLPPLPQKPFLSLWNKDDGAYSALVVLPPGHPAGDVSLKVRELSTGKPVDMHQRHMPVVALGEVCSVAVDTMVLVCSGEVNEFYATEWEIWFTPEGEKEPKCLGKQEFLLMGTKSWW